MNRKADELHERLVQAVRFVPPDDGADATTDVTIRLEDLRALVGAAWAAVDEVATQEREVRRYRNMYHRVMNRNETA